MSLFRLAFHVTSPRDGADPLPKVDRLTSEVRQQQAAEAELEASPPAARRDRQLQ